MKFIKGLLCFVLMFVLSVCTLLWVGANIVGDSILSPDANKALLNETSFSLEVVNGILDQYNMDMGQLAFEESDIMTLVNDSGEGVIEYVFLEEETLPVVDVTFIKKNIQDEVDRATRRALENQVDLKAFINVLREIPQGEGVLITSREYLDSLGVTYEKEDLDQVLEVFKEHKDLSDEEIQGLMVEAIADEVLDVDAMKTNLSLQDFFDRLMKKNPFGVLRMIVEVYNKDVNGYLLITMALLVLAIVAVEFRLTNIFTWMGLTMTLSIIPLQLLRLAKVAMDTDFLSLFEGASSYTFFMFDQAIASLNKYTIIFTLALVIFFVLAKVLRKEAVENEKRYKLVRLAAFLILGGVLYLNMMSAFEMNMNLYAELMTLDLSDFDVSSIDLTLRDLLNIDYNF